MADNFEKQADLYFSVMFLLEKVNLEHCRHSLDSGRDFDFKIALLCTSGQGCTCISVSSAVSVTQSAMSLTESLLIS